MKLLEGMARRFAVDASDLLNRTVTTGVRVSSALWRPQLCVVGVGVTRNHHQPRIVPLRLRSSTASGFLRLAYTLGMDDEKQFLTVHKSCVGVGADPDGERTLVHYDYDRAPGNGYSNPHVQVEGESLALRSMCERSPHATRRLGGLHFPVGGRRFRPTLEDVIEFLITERLAAAHPGWEAAIEEHRTRWWETQVKACVRRHPEWAAHALRTQGWAIKPPDCERST